MSLINQVLRDLDQRRAAPAAASPAVRTTPASRSRRGAWMVIAGVATLGIAASAVAWSSLGSYQGRSSFSTWLHGIAHHVYVDWRRQKKFADAQAEDWWERCAADGHAPSL